MTFEHFVSKLVVTFQLPHVQMFYEIILKLITKPLFSIWLLPFTYSSNESPHLNCMFSFTSNVDSKFWLWSSSIIMLCNITQAIMISIMAFWSHCLPRFIIVPNLVCRTFWHHFVSLWATSCALAKWCSFSP
jgi:hypothetical protein